MHLQTTSVCIRLGSKVPVSCYDGGSKSLWNSVGQALWSCSPPAHPWLLPAGPLQLMARRPCTQHALLCLCLCSCIPLCILENVPRPHPHHNLGNSCFPFFDTQLAQASSPLAPRATPQPPGRSLPLFGIPQHLEGLCVALSLELFLSPRLDI